MTLDIPHSLSLVTLRQYLAYHLCADDAERVAVITGISVDQAKSLRMDRVKEVIEIFEGCLNQTPEKFNRVVKVGKLKVGFIPDLTWISLDEHIELDNLAKEIWATDTPDYRSLPKLLAVLFRPVTSQVGAYYDIEPYDGTKVKKYMQFFDELTMDTVTSALLFFSTIAKELKISSIEYLKDRLRERTQTLKDLAMMED